jgi:hypothetical protein
MHLYDGRPYSDSYAQRLTLNERWPEVLLKGMSSEKHFSLPEIFSGIQPPRHSADTSSLAA